MARHKILVAVGKGYQIVELDEGSQKFTAAWPVTERIERSAAKYPRPKELKGDLRKAYYAARKGVGAGAIRPFGAGTVAEEKPEGVRVELRRASRLGGYAKPFVAKIVGADRRYRLAREFLDPSQDWTYYLTADGYYHVCNRNSKGAKREWYLKVENGESHTVDRAEVEAAFPLPADTTPPAHAVLTVDPTATGPDRLASIAEVAKSRAPHGQSAEQFLPYVRAALQYWTAIESEAVDVDNTRLAFLGTSQRLEFERSFESLTGRKFDLSQDAIESVEVEALPDPGPAPVCEAVYECWECGYVTRDPGEIEPGGMGCVQCG